MRPVCRHREKRGRPAYACADGMTLIELLVSVAIVGLLAAISANVYANALETSRVTRTIAEIRGIEKAIADFQVQGDLPDSLDDIDWGHLDPWGNLIST